MIGRTVRILRSAEDCCALALAVEATREDGARADALRLAMRSVEAGDISVRDAYAVLDVTSDRDDEEWLAERLDDEKNHVFPD